MVHSLVEPLSSANGNLASLGYDGFDRLAQWSFPSKTTSGQISATDYESYGYDAAGNRTTFRKRDGRVLRFTYDGLNRVVIKEVPGGCAPIQVGACPPASATRNVYYGYDVRGLQTYARFDGSMGEGVVSAYDGFGRLTTSTMIMSGVNKTLAYQYDARGNRTQILHPDGVHFDTAYAAADRMTSATWFTLEQEPYPFCSYTMTISVSGSEPRLTTLRVSPAIAMTGYRG